MYALLTGLILGFSLIISIGAQNLFVIKQGVYRQRPYLTATICFLCCISLVGLSVTSVGMLIMQIDGVKTILSIGGILFLVGLGSKSIYSAIKKKPRPVDMSNDDKQMLPFFTTVLTAISVSFLNPQAIFETFVMIGGAAAQYSDTQQLAFMVGVIIGSFTWFYSLALVSSKVSHYMTKPNAFRILEAVSGILMLFIAIQVARMSF